ncbi:MAG: hypothetical protein ABIH49_03510 [archaeon]
MKISSEKKERISEQILAFLYSSNSKPQFTSQIAREIVRDEEFTKSLLIELRKKKLVAEIKKSPKGRSYSRRSRWALSEAAYGKYKAIAGYSG